MRHRLQEISVFAPLRSIDQLPAQDAFEFREDRPHHWLQKICIKILRRLQCHSWINQPKVERHVIDGDDFMVRLVDQKYIALDELGDRRRYWCFMGPDEYNDLMGKATSYGLGFDAFYSVAPGGRYEGPKVLDMPIEVVPWMKGVLVAPEPERRARP